VFIIPHFHTLTQSEHALHTHRSSPHTGHRIMAFAYCPIADQDTLVYGSNDLGKHVFNSDAEIDALMTQLGEHMNLKRHGVLSQV
jgi:hypothetical protein